MCSGEMGNSGIRRGRGMVRKWMDGRIVKDDAMRRGTQSIVQRIFCTTETFNEGLGTIRLCMRGESSH